MRLFRLKGGCAGKEVCVHFSKATRAFNSSPCLPGFGVVVTGGTKGVGFALCREFLKRGDRVLLCSRNKQRVDAAVSALQTEYPSAEVYGAVCDVSLPADAKYLANCAKTKLKSVHFWINNAASTAYKVSMCIQSCVQVCLSILACTAENAIRFGARRHQGSRSDEPAGYTAMHTVERCPHTHMHAHPCV
jgi:NAD(P)-dependent dehydrogenase (short-subunit alcohol dehydrogenase family)